MQWLVQSAGVIALATCAELPTGYLEDELAERLGATWAVWDDPAVDWRAFALVVMRSTWDYQRDLPGFLRWARSVPRLVNPAEVVAWNTDKRYEVAAAGLPVVETTFLTPGDALPGVLPDELVLKPTVSAARALAYQAATYRRRGRPADDEDLGRAVPRRGGVERGGRHRRTRPAPHPARRLVPTVRSDARGRPARDRWCCPIGLPHLGRPSADKGAPAA